MNKGVKLLNIFNTVVLIIGLALSFFELFSRHLHFDLDIRTAYFRTTLLYCIIFLLILTIVNSSPFVLSFFAKKNRISLLISLFLSSINICFFIFVFNNIDTLNLYLYTTIQLTNTHLITILNYINSIKNSLIIFVVSNIFCLIKNILILFSKKPNFTYSL